MELNPDPKSAKPSIDSIGSPKLGHEVCPLRTLNAVTYAYALAQH